MRSFTPRSDVSWELQGIQATPFAYSKWHERPVVAVFKHVARTQDGVVVEDFQCSYPNVVAYNQEELAAAQASPIGHFRLGMKREALDLAANRMTRLFDAVSTFKAATDAEIDALMPNADVIVFVPQVEERHLKYA